MIISCIYFGIVLVLNVLFITYLSIITLLEYSVMRIMNTLNYIRSKVLILYPVRLIL